MYIWGIVFAADMIFKETENFIWGVFVHNINAGWGLCGFCLEVEVNDIIL